MSRVVSGYSYALGQTPDVSKYLKEYAKNRSQLQKQNGYDYGKPGLAGTAIGVVAGITLATGLGIAMGLTGGFLAPVVYAAVGLAPIAIGFFRGRSLGKNAPKKIDELKEQGEAIREKVLAKIVAAYDPARLTGKKIHDHMQNTSSKTVAGVRSDYLSAGEAFTRATLDKMDRGNYDKNEPATKKVVAQLRGAPAVKV